MAEPFATVTDLEAGWRALPESDVGRAMVLLARASRKERAEKKGIDDLITAGDMDPDLVGDVVCQMVKRAMQGPVDLDGVTQAQQTAGPFQMGATFANPSGDLYLSKAEKKDLGIGAQRAFTVDLLADESSSSS